MNQNLNGYLIINKPLGWTSFDCVNYIKKKCRIKKVGHGGTLDPIATGVIVILINRETKRFDWHQQAKKIYETEYLLGIKTETLDITSPCTNFSPITPNETQLLETIQKFTGTIQQTPPKFSAIKIKGKRAYEYARKGEAVDIKPKKVSIHQIDLIDYEYPIVKMQIHCQKGVYIRSLIRDIGEELQTHATMCSLTRIEQSNHKITEAIDLKKIDKFNVRDHLKQSDKAI